MCDVPRQLPSEPERLLHIPGEMNIDCYPPLLLISLYRPFSPQEIDDLAEKTNRAYPKAPLLVQDRSVRPFRVVLEKGDIPDEMTVTEGGLQYYVNPKRGQNPGFFIDMRNGRRLIGELVHKGKLRGKLNVLNLFSYTCSLSVAALAAGADRVVNIDMNRKSLDLGKRNHRLNHGLIPGGYGTQALFLPHDIFKSFGKLKREGPYELIIADPPPSQKGSFDLRKDYPRLMKRLPDMMSPGGILLLTLNTPEMDWGEFEEMARNSLGIELPFRRIEPPRDFTPREEGRGLKMLLFERT